MLWTLPTRQDGLDTLDGTTSPQSYEAMRDKDPIVKQIDQLAGEVAYGQHSE